MSIVDRVQADAHAIGLFFLEIGVTQYAHGRHEVVHAIEVPFLECPEIPHARVHLTDGLVDVALILVLGFGGVQTGSAKPGQVLIVGGRSAANRRSFREVIVHVLQVIHHPLGHGRVLDVVPKVSEAVLPERHVIDERRVVDHDICLLVEAVELHELVVVVERNAKTVRDGILQAEGRANARLQVAEAEAKAIRMVAEAVAKTKADPTQYLIAVRYVEALEKMMETSNDKSRVVFMPYEASGMMGSVGSIKELLKD